MLVIYLFDDSGIELMSYRMLGKHCTTALRRQASFYFLTFDEGLIKLARQTSNT